MYPHVFACEQCLDLPAATVQVYTGCRLPSQLTVDETVNKETFLGIKDAKQRARQSGSPLASIRGYLIVVAIFIAFLLFIGAVVVIERFILGWA